MWKYVISRCRDRNANKFNTSEKENFGGGSGSSSYHIILLVLRKDLEECEQGGSDSLYAPWRSFDGVHGFLSMYLNVVQCTHTTHIHK